MIDNMTNLTRPEEQLLARETANDLAQKLGFNPELRLDGAVLVLIIRPTGLTLGGAGKSDLHEAVIIQKAIGAAAEFLGSQGRENMQSEPMPGEGDKS